MDNIPQALTEYGLRNVIFPVPGRDDDQGYLSPINNESEYGIIVLQEWWGLNKAICTQADTIASQGFRALCPDIYRGKVGQNREDAGHLRNGLDFAGAVKDISAAGEYLRTLGCKKVAITGFCMGGALTLATLASDQSFIAGAPFYGIPDIDAIDLSKAKMPIQAHFGAHDKVKGFSSPEDAQRLDDKGKQLGLNIQTIIWPDAGHAFMNQDSPFFHKETANKALAEVVAFFKKSFAINE